MEEPAPKEPSVEVLHCILVRQGRIIRPGDPGTGWWETSDPLEQAYRLDGASYQYWVPPDTEFPKYAKPPWAVYLRATGCRAGPTRVLFRVHYRNPRGDWEHLFEREMDRPIPFPEKNEETHDVVLNLPYLRFGGVGLHAISVHFWYDEVELDEVDGSPEDTLEGIFLTPGWAFGSFAYFWIVKQS